MRPFLAFKKIASIMPCKDRKKFPFPFGKSAGCPWRVGEKKFSQILSSLNCGGEDLRAFSQTPSPMIGNIKNVISHIQDSDMVELAGQVLEAMSDAEFAEVALETAE